MPSGKKNKLAKALYVAGAIAAGSALGGAVKPKETPDIRDDAPIASNISEQIKSRLNTDSNATKKEIKKDSEYMARTIYFKYPLLKDKWEEIKSSFHKIKTDDPEAWKKLTDSTKPSSPEADVELHMRVEKLHDVVAKVMIRNLVMDDRKFTEDTDTWLEQRNRAATNDAAAAISAMEEFFHAWDVDREAATRALAFMMEYAKFTLPAPESELLPDEQEVPENDGERTETL